MKKFFVTTAVLLTIMSTAQASIRFSREDIAKLPQDKVEAIRKHCERWGSDFEMRMYCEDEQYKALRDLIDRGSIR